MNSINSSAIQAQEFLNAQYLRELAGPQDYDAQAVACHRSLASQIETEWIRRELANIDVLALPRTAGEFDAWYRSCFRQQVSAAEPFFEHLAYHATLDELSVYVLYEEQVDGRFDDVISLAQLGLPARAKLALAMNYWDEMGEGDETRMHTRMFCESAAYFRHALQDSPSARFVRPTAQALANGNLLMLLAIRREHCAKLLGALTLLEHTAPKRFSRAVAGMRRLHVPEATIDYHEMHVKVDAKHGDDLLNEVVLPMLEDRPDLTSEVAIGVQMRLHVANRYYAMLAEVFEAVRAQSRPVPA